MKAARRPTRAARIAAYDSIQTELRLPDKQGIFQYLSTRIFSLRSAVSEQMVRVMLGLLVPNQKLIGDALDEQTTCAELTELGYALAAYRADHGRYPPALGALVPEYVARVPADVFDNQSLRYETTNSGYVLYSVGLDGKDNHGHAATDPHAAEQQDTDIVF